IYWPDLLESRNRPEFFQQLAIKRGPLRRIAERFAPGALDVWCHFGRADLNHCAARWPEGRRMCSPQWLGDRRRTRIIHLSCRLIGLQPHAPTARPREAFVRVASTAEPPSSR